MFSGIRSQNYPNPPAYIKKKVICKVYVPLQKKKAYHIKNIISPVKHGSDSVMIWGCFTASEQLDNWWTTNSETPEGEWPAISLCPEKVDSGHVAVQWP